jgi:hypothetical protein
MAAEAVAFARTRRSDSAEPNSAPPFPETPRRQSARAIAPAMENYMTTIRTPDHSPDWERLAEAASFALTIHARQMRKGTPIPYISHLLGVASLGPIDIQDSRRPECVIHGTPDSRIWSLGDGQTV